MQKALESALAELVLDARLDLSDRTCVEAWLERHGVEAGDAQAILESELPRLAVYRRLVRGTLREALNASIPRSIARLGPVFEDYFDRFLRERGPRTHYLRDVTREFLDFCAEHWPSDPHVPPYLRDLAQHESLHIDIAAATQVDPRPQPVALDLEAGLSFSEACRLLQLEHAVHRLSEALDDRTEPERVPTHLLAYRSVEHDVRYLELTPLASAIIERLMQGASLKESLLEATSEHGASLDEALITATAHLLADLAERSVVLGARASARSRNSSPPAKASKLPPARASLPDKATKI